jgi:hypothetical protein
VVENVGLGPRLDFQHVFDKRSQLIDPENCEAVRSAEKVGARPGSSVLPCPGEPERVSDRHPVFTSLAEGSVD